MVSASDETETPNSAVKLEMLADIHISIYLLFLHTTSNIE